MRESQGGTLAQGLVALAGTFLDLVPISGESTLTTPK